MCHLSVTVLAGTCYELSYSIYILSVTCYVLSYSIYILSVTCYERSCHSCIQLCDGLGEICTENLCKGKVVTDSRSIEGLQVILTMDGTGENVANLLVQTGLASRSV